MASLGDRYRRDAAGGPAQPLRRGLAPGTGGPRRVGRPAAPSRSSPPGLAGPGSALALVLALLAAAASAGAGQPRTAGPAPASAPSSGAPAAAPSAGAARAAPALRADLDRVFADAGVPAAGLACRVVALADPASGAPAEVLYSVRADLPLVPASTMKLVTTAACLDRFGADWRIRTWVGRLPPADPSFPCDLGVVGGGDPNFSGRFFGGDPVGAFRRWAAALRDRGVGAVGRIVLDDTLFDRVGQHPNWPADQRAEWYEAPAGALGVNDNCVDVRVSPAEVGRPAFVRLDPIGGYAVLEGSIQTVADRKDHRYSIERVVAGGPQGGMRIRAAGACWARAGEAVESRAALDPTVFFGMALAETLRSEGIAVAGPVVRERLVDARGQARPDFACDVIHASRLDATLAVANKRSQGLYAECLLKLLGAYGPDPAPAAPALRPATEGSWATGTAEARRWLAEAGVPLDGCVLDDGSGLSKENRLTALAVTELLRVMYERHGEAFVRTLAEPGQDGSLSRRMRGTEAEGRVWGKTGYVSGTSALSGYVRARSGRWVVYAVLMNQVPWGQLWRARQAQDRVCVRLVES